MGRLVITSLEQMCARGKDLHLQCGRCRRAIVLRRYELALWVKALRWPRGFAEIARRFPCRACGRLDRIEWGFIAAVGDQPLALDLAAIARTRRDGHLLRARFWHALAQGRDPVDPFGPRVPRLAPSQPR